MPKSLNYVIRKQSILKIEDDNIRFAKKLMECNGTISKKKLDDDYQLYTKYRNQLLRVAKKNKKYHNH